LCQNKCEGRKDKNGKEIGNFYNILATLFQRAMNFGNIINMARKKNLDSLSSTYNLHI
jgi:hypothetical protein